MSDRERSMDARWQQLQEEHYSPLANERMLSFSSSSDSESRGMPERPFSPFTPEQLAINERMLLDEFSRLPGDAFGSPEDPEGVDRIRQAVLRASSGQWQPSSQAGRRQSMQEILSNILTSPVNAQGSPRGMPERPFSPFTPEQLAINEQMMLDEFSRLPEGAFGSPEDPEGVDRIRQAVLRASSGQWRPRILPGRPHSMQEVLTSILTTPVYGQGDLPAEADLLEALEEECSPLPDEFDFFDFSSPEEMAALQAASLSPPRIVITDDNLQTFPKTLASPVYQAVGGASAAYQSPPRHTITPERLDGAIAALGVPEVYSGSSGYDSLAVPTPVEIPVQVASPGGQVLMTPQISPYAPLVDRWLYRTPPGRTYTGLGRRAIRRTPPRSPGGSPVLRDDRANVVLSPSRIQGPLAAAVAAPTISRALFTSPVASPARQATRKASRLRMAPLLSRSPATQPAQALARPAAARVRSPAATLARPAGARVRFPATAVRPRATQSANLRVSPLSPRSPPLAAARVRPPARRVRPGAFPGRGPPTRSSRLRMAPLLSRRPVIAARTGPSLIPRPSAARARPAGAAAGPSGFQRRTYGIRDRASRIPLWNFGGNRPTQQLMRTRISTDPDTEVTLETASRVVANNEVVDQNYQISKI